MPLVLVVEDELTLAQTIELYLRQQGYRTERAGNGVQALALFRASRPDLVILDLGLPELDGLQVLRTIRAKFEVPVVILTARAEEADELLGLGLGADDYLIKPVSARKLLAHVKAVLNRQAVGDRARSRVRSGGLDIDQDARLVTVHGRHLALTPTEYHLLFQLASMPGRAWSRAELYEATMPESEAYERAVDIHIANLRRKLREVGFGEAIVTVRGVGYRLRP